jgi:hypothetical protein
MTREPESIGDYLRLHVETNYRSITEAAEAFGCSKSHLSLVLTGRRRPTPTMCDAMGVQHHEVWCPKPLPVPGLRMRLVPVHRGRAASVQGAAR